MTAPAAGALIVFARAPRPGRVKTRLAATLGTTKAAEIYATLLEHALTLAPAGCFAARYLFCAAADERDYFAARLAHDNWRVAVQRGGDLGTRMFNAFEAVLAEARFAVLMGSDIADSTTADLQQAHAVLAAGTRHAVIGPVADGGYWLLGLSQVRRAFFTEIAWGSGDVAAATQTRLQRGGLRVQRLAERHDVDIAADIAYLPGGAGGAVSDADERH